jgi:hypothetical protein
VRKRVAYNNISQIQPCYDTFTSDTVDYVSTAPNDDFPSDDVQVVETLIIGNHDVSGKEVAVSDNFISSFKAEVFKGK